MQLCKPPAFWVMAPEATDGALWFPLLHVVFQPHAHRWLSDGLTHTEVQNEPILLLRGLRHVPGGATFLESQDQHPHPVSGRSQPPTPFPTALLLCAPHKLLGGLFPGLPSPSWNDPL